MRPTAGGGDRLVVDFFFEKNVCGCFFLFFEKNVCGGFFSKKMFAECILGTR